VCEFACFLFNIDKINMFEVADLAFEKFEARWVKVEKNGQKGIKSHNKCQKEAT